MSCWPLSAAVPAPYWMHELINNSCALLHYIRPACNLCTQRCPNRSDPVEGGLQRVSESAEVICQRIKMMSISTRHCHAAAKENQRKKLLVFFRAWQHRGRHHADADAWRQVRWITLPFWTACRQQHNLSLNTQYASDIPKAQQKGLKRKKIKNKKKSGSATAAPAVAAAYPDGGYEKKSPQMTAALQPRLTDRLLVFYKEAPHLNSHALQWAFERALSKAPDSNLSILQYLFRWWPMKLIYI